MKIFSPYDILYQFVIRCASDEDDLDEYIRGSSVRTIIACVKMMKNSRDVLFYGPPIYDKDVDTRFMIAMRKLVHRGREELETHSLYWVGILEEEALATLKEKW